MRPRLISVILVSLFFAIALFLRAYPTHDQVFTSEWIKFTGNDAYYQMYLVDNLVHNFPRLTTFSPYLLYPGGMGVGTVHFFNWLIAGVVWIIGLGSPSQHTVDVVGVYFPAVVGALTVIPVFFIGKELFGRWAGLIAAGLIAILPGEFLGRSILGFTDQHVAETLLSATAMLFLILAVKSASQRGLSWRHFRRPDWKIITRPVIYSVLAGVFMGLYIFTWLGAMLLIFIAFTYFVVQFIIDHLKGKSTDYLGLVGGIVFFVTLVLFLPILPTALYLLSLLVSFLATLVLNGISRLMSASKTKPVYFPAAVIGLGLAGVGLLYLVSPSLFTGVIDAFSVFTPTATLLTTLEAQPLFRPTTAGGGFLATPAWGNFTTDLFLSFISLIILLILTVRRGESEKTVLLVWSLVVLAAAIAQRRFAYYLAVNVALLVGYLSWQVLELAGVRESVPVASKRKEIAKKKRRQRRPSSQTASPFVVVLLAIVVFFVAFFWNIEPAIATASQTPFAPSNAWCDSLAWLEANTPDPFGDPSFYYHRETNRRYSGLYELMRNVPNPSGDPNFYYQLEASYQYPESAYGVLAWWDYGYWITRIAHRIPNANPSQDPLAVSRVASYFTAQDEISANKIAQEMGTGYVVIDYETVTSKFWAVATWAGKQPADFYSVYWNPQEQSAKTYLYPEYYGSQSVRLYHFDGKAVTPEKSLVISYQLRSTPDGMYYNEVLSETEFSSYEEAEAYIASQQSGNYRIVGTDPMVSPVPLEELKNYKLVYSTADSVMISNTGTVPAIKIFQFTDWVPLYKP